MLIVDNSLGFVFWLGHLLDAAGYSAYPAKSVADAALLLIQLDLSPSLLVINPALPAADTFISGLHRSHPDLRAIAVVEDLDSQRHFPGINVCLPTPRILDNSADAEWLNCVRELLKDNAYSHIGLPA